MEKRNRIEKYKELCVYCNEEHDMYYTTHQIIEYIYGHKEIKHEITLRQCSFCKMIQYEEVE